MSLEEYVHYWTLIPPKRSEIDRRYQKHVRTNLNSSHRKGSGENTGSLVRRRDDSKVWLWVSNETGCAGAEGVGAAWLPRAGARFLQGISYWLIKYKKQTKTWTIQSGVAQSVSCCHACVRTWFPPSEHTGKGLGVLEWSWYPSSGRQKKADPWHWPASQPTYWVPGH